MDDTPEVIRQQMIETKSQLSMKLESIEQQVFETVQATGNTVSATVGLVLGSVQSASRAIDLNLQMKKHPWLILGGATVLGYLAAEFLEGSAQNSEHQESTRPFPESSNNHASHRNGKRLAGSTRTNGAVAATQAASSGGSAWHQLRTATITALIGAVHTVAARATPQLLDYFNRSLSRPDGTAVDPHGAQNGPQSQRAGAM